MTNRGGKREGAGRKPDPNAKQQIAFRLDPVLVRYLRSRKSQTDTLEKALKRSKDFRDWKRGK